MSFTKHKNKTVYEKVFLVKSIHNSRDSLKKVWKLQLKFREFHCLTGYSVLILCYSKLISFLLFETIFAFMLFALVIWYVIHAIDGDFDAFFVGREEGFNIAGSFVRIAIYGLLAKNSKKLKFYWESWRQKASLRSRYARLKGNGEQSDLCGLQQVTLKPQLQFHHCLTTWLQIWYHNLLRSGKGTILSAILSTRQNRKTDLLIRRLPRRAVTG